MQGASWSGKERNHFFLNAQGKQFHDISGISGMDHIADSRVFATLDIDHDGFQDVALLNISNPPFVLYRNTIGEHRKEAGRAGHFIAVRFVGGNRAASLSEGWSNRDGYGAMLTVTSGELRQMREHRCGEGLAAQNSATILVGIGEAERASSIEVRWPSGRKQQLKDVAAGSLVTLYEDPKQSPNAEHFTIAPYQLQPTEGESRPAAETAPKEQLILADTRSENDPSRLRMYTTTATWCKACRKTLPQLRRLRAHFAASDLGMFGVPYDEEESTEKLLAYHQKQQPGYEMLTEITGEQRTRVEQLVTAALDAEGLPASIITDAQGTILLTTWGVPSISTIRKLLIRAPAQGSGTDASPKTSM